MISLSFSSALASKTIISSDNPLILSSLASIVLVIVILYQFIITLILPCFINVLVLLFEFLSKPFNDDVREPFDWDNKFNKGETKYALLHNALGKEFSISASKFEVSYNGFEVTEVDGNRLVTHFEELELGETAIIKITALEEAVEDIIYIDNTSKGDPANISFYDLGSDITYTFYYEGEVKWFTFYCYKAGEVQISVTNGSVSKESIIVEPFEDYYFSITATSAGEVILTTKFIESN